MAILRKAADVLYQVIRTLLVLSMIIMVIAMFMQVLGRWLSLSLSWTEELTRFACIWLIFMGSALLASEGEHIAVTILDSIFKGKALAILNQIRRVIFIIFSCIIVWAGFQAAGMVATQTSPNMGLPMSIMYISIPIGSLLTAFYLVLNVIAPPAAESEEIAEGGDAE